MGEEKACGLRGLRRRLVRSSLVATARNTESRRRDIPIETMRGIACVLLVAFHVIGDSATAGIHVADDSGFRYFANSFQYVRMPLFSFISGVVYAWRPV